VDITIAVESDQGEADLRSLQQWLLREPGLRQVPLTRPAAVPRQGDMGAFSDILLASLGGGGAGAVLANSVSVWLQSRVKQVRVRIEGPRGSVEVEVGNAADPAALIQRVLEERPSIDGPPSDGDGDGGSPPGGAS
jgi:hypothetical protein